MSKKKNETPVGQLTKTALLCHSFNAERSRVAVCDSSPDVLIFKVDGRDASKWTLESTLKAVCSVANH